MTAARQSPCSPGPLLPEDQGKFEEAFPFGDETQGSKSFQDGLLGCSFLPLTFYALHLTWDSTLWPYGAFNLLGQVGMRRADLFLQRTRARHLLTHLRQQPSMCPAYRRVFQTPAATSIPSTKRENVASGSCCPVLRSSLAPCTRCIRV